MKEQVVSIKVAELLKELGFNWKCSYTFLSSADTCGHDLRRIPIDWNNEVNSFNEKIWLSAPTLSLAQKWLRDIHAINISIDWVQNQPAITEWYNIVTKIGKPLKEYIVFESEHYNTHEAALEAGIQTALEYLKNKKTCL